MFEFLIKKLKAHPRKIVFTEGTDPRILEASARLLSGTFLTPVLVGNPEEVQKVAEEIGFNIRYLMEALRYAPADTGKIELNTGVSPAIIVPSEGEENFLYMVLPVRLKSAE